MKAIYGLSPIAVIGLLSISAVFAEEPQIKIVDWIPHTILTDQKTTFTAKIYDAKYNPGGDRESGNPVLDNVNVAILIFNKNYEIEYHFQGVTKYGIFQPSFVLPEKIREGKYFVEIIAWNKENFDYKSKILFIEHRPIPSGGNQRNNP